jgi:hypothetical protein
MAHTTSLAKLASSQAKNTPPKILKLAKARIVKKSPPPKLSSVSARKNEQGTRTAMAAVQAIKKPKAAQQTANKKSAVPNAAKSATKSAKGNSAPAKTRSQHVKPVPAVAAIAANKGRGMNTHILRTVAAPGKIKQAETRSATQAEASLPERAGVPAGEVQKLSREDIKIFQIYYQPEQQSLLDSEFIAYDNSGNSSRLFEFAVFTKLAQSSEIRSAKLWGALSWKFGKKAGISGRELKDEIIAHPGYDAYYCNPYPENEALYHNMWLQGELAHPNFMPLCAEIFEVAGLPAELLTSVQPSSEFAAANYFVANQNFWRAYIGFISRLLISADKKLSPTARRIFYSSTADKFGAHAEASYIPFLVERLFTVFLLVEGEKFKTLKLNIPGREKKENVHLKLLTEMKDLACRKRSLWLAACWINYRNLYLSKIYGDGWSKQHLKQITPASITFMPENFKMRNRI